MALTYPRLITTDYQWQRADIRLRRREQYSRSRNYTQVKDLADPVWVGDFLSANMPYVDASALHAQLEALAGRPFYAHTEERKQPATYAGEDLSNIEVSFISSDRATISLTGAPADFVLTQGDYFHVVNGTNKLSLHRVMEDVTGTAGGLISTFEITPPLHPEAVVTDPVGFLSPRAKMRLDAESLALNRISGDLWSVAFSCEEYRE